MQKIMALIFIMKFICGKCTGEKLIEEVSVKEKFMKFARNDVLWCFFFLNNVVQELQVFYSNLLHYKMVICCLLQ